MSGVDGQLLIKAPNDRFSIACGRSDYGSKGWGGVDSPKAPILRKVLIKSDQILLIC